MTTIKCPCCGTKITVIPASTATEQKTCRTCKHFEVLKTNETLCHGETKQYSIYVFTPDKDFGCNLHEPKEDL